MSPAVWEKSSAGVDPVLEAERRRVMALPSGAERDRRIIAVMIKLREIGKLNEYRRRTLHAALQREKDRAACAWLCQGDSE